MAKLKFSFAGESIQSSKLESKTRRFDLEFESNTYLSFQQNPTFSVEYFFSINNYAENFSDAFHMAAKEAGIKVEQLNIQITGNLDSDKHKKAVIDGITFNRIDVSLSIVSNAPTDVLEQLLKFANELNPIEDSIAKQVHFQFSLNSILHLN
jgi:hypothetical protein